MAKHGLAYGPLGAGRLHLCVDMQFLFAPGPPWEVPWAQRVLPAIEEIAQRHAEATVFTRFIPQRAPGQGRGAWARYYRRWAAITLDSLDPRMIDLMPQLTRLAPPAQVVDEQVEIADTETVLSNWQS